MATILAASPSLSVVVAGLVAVYILRLVLYRFFTDPLLSIPGPEITKWTDIHVRFLVLTGGRAAYVHSLHEKYGPVVRVGPKELDFSDYNAAREIHRLNSGFIKSNFYNTGKAPQSLFSTRDVRFHAARRRVLGPCFSESALNAREPVVRALVQAAVDGIGRESKVTGYADVLKWWTLMAMDIIGELSFGDSFGMVQRGFKTQFAEDVANAGSILPLRTAFPWLVALGGYLPIPKFNDMARSRQRVIAHQAERVGHFMKLVEEEPDSEKTNKTLFASLIKDKKSDLTQLDLTIEGQSYITAGTDTTAVTLTYILWAVCRRDKVRNKLLSELEALPSEFSYKDIRSLTYLDCVVEEGLRCYGAAPGALPRDSPPQGATLAGVHIPPGVVVSTQGYSIHRDTTVFPNPESFDPSRWLAPSKEMQDAFVAFGTGPRVCIGHHLARMELRLATALFFHTYPNARISAREGMSGADMEESITFLLMPKGHRCLVEVN